MSNINDELKQGLKLLKLEWSEDLAQYKKKFLNTSIADKKKEGITWHPIQLKKSKIGNGGKTRLQRLVEGRRSSVPPYFWQWYYHPFIRLREEKYFSGTI